jgi:hypothetical protein
MSLVVRTGGANDMVMITDNSTTGQTTVVADGKTLSFSQRFGNFPVDVVNAQR